MDRRQLLSTGGRLGATVLLLGGVSSCATATPVPAANPSSTESPSPMTSQNRTLVVYFSRPGENYYYGGRTNLEVGNTQVVADLIAQVLAVDVHRVTAADPYSADYGRTVARNVEEQQRNARPALGEPLPDTALYDAILIGSPIWNVQPPMLMKTFVEGLDLSGKALFPFTTHAMSGLGTAARFYRDAAPGARIGEGLAIRGEEAAASRPAITTWLRTIGLLT